MPNKIVVEGEIFYVDYALGGMSTSKGMRDFKTRPGTGHENKETEEKEAHDDDELHTKVEED